LLQLFVLLKERKLNRLFGYDYSKSGWYFVTICTNTKGNVLGNVNNGKMVLNELGGIVEKQWCWLLDKFEYLKYDEWIIMPDHIHGIMVIGNYIVGNGRDVRNSRNCSVQNKDDATRSVHGKIKSISELIGAFKTTSSKEIHNLGFNDFKWHKSFYDEIIGDEISLNRIRKYIIENPKNFVKAK